MSPRDDHVSPETLALIGLGEPAGDDAAHLADCALCQAEVDSYRSVVSAGRSLSSADHPVAPPPVVWDRIRDEIGLEVTGSGPTGSTDESTSLAEVVPLRRRWSTGLLVAASVVSLAAGVTAALVVTGGSDAPPTSVVAQAELAALPGHQGVGRAQVLTANSRALLEVSQADLSTDGDGFFEVWLIDPDTFEMVGLGVLDGDSGTFAVPAGLDLSRFSVVDISLEPFDGDPTHSTDSVVRGQLDI